VAQFLLVLALVSLCWAILERWWSLGLPAMLTLFAAVVYLAGQPTPGGGDGDPMRLIGMGLLVFSGPWLALVLVFHAQRLWFRGRSADSEHQP
jgi:hypothetical protein